MRANELVLAFSFAVAACGSSHARTSAPQNSTPATRDAATTEELPAEVTKLTERWETCWHFAGEEATDAARRKEIEDGVAAWCTGNEDERARLEAKYRDRADVQTALKKLDEMQ
jgi:hypothetical protein